MPCTMVTGVEVKKVKVTLRPGSTGKKIYLFPSPEALYVWLCAVEEGEHVNVPNLIEVPLQPGGFIEAELRGFEHAFEGAGRFRRLDFVRLGHAQQPKNASGLLVNIHAGWVAGGLLPMRRYSDADVDVCPLDEQDARLQLHVLFDDESHGDD